MCDDINFHQLTLQIHRVSTVEMYHLLKSLINNMVDGEKIYLGYKFNGRLQSAFQNAMCISCLNDLYTFRSINAGKYLYKVSWCEIRDLRILIRSCNVDKVMHMLYNNMLYKVYGIRNIFPS